MKTQLSHRVVAALLSLAAFALNAQESKPTPASASAATAAAEKASTASVPKHGCPRPDLPGRFDSDDQQKQFVKKMDGYRDCLMAYRNDMTKLAQAHIAAANAAIEEFNAFVGELNKK